MAVIYGVVKRGKNFIYFILWLGKAVGGGERVLFVVVFDAGVGILYSLG